MSVRILTGDVRAMLATLPDESVHCVVTSPPYWGLRCYGVDGQIGQEPTLQGHVDVMVEVFQEVRRVLRKDGTVWLNYGDSYTRSQTGNVPQTKNPLVTYPAHCKSGSSDGAVGRGDRPGTRNGVDGLKPKDLCMMPARVALALQADGWWLRSEIIWHKPNPMPESITDRPTSSHEKIYLLARSERYYFDAEAVREPHLEISLARAQRNRFGGKYQGADPREHGALKSGNGYGPDGNPDIVCSPGGRNIRNVWTIATAPFPGAHFATFPPALIEPCIKAGCPEGGTVLDPFGGAGTTGLVADRLKRNAILIELNPEYADMARARIQADGGMFAEVAAL